MLRRRKIIEWRSTRYLYLVCSQMQAHCSARREAARNRHYPMPAQHNSLRAGCCLADFCLLDGRTAAEGSPEVAGRPKAMIVNLKSLCTIGLGVVHKRRFEEVGVALLIRHAGRLTLTRSGETLATEEGGARPVDTPAHRHTGILAARCSSSFPLQ